MGPDCEETQLAILGAKDPELLPITAAALTLRAALAAGQHAMQCNWMCTASATALRCPHYRFDCHHRGCLGVGTSQARWLYGDMLHFCCRQQEES